MSKHQIWRGLNLNLYYYISIVWNYYIFPLGSHQRAGYVTMMKCKFGIQDMSKYRSRIIKLFYWCFIRELEKYLTSSYIIWVQFYFQDKTNTKTKWKKSEKKRTKRSLTLKFLHSGCYIALIPKAENSNLNYKCKGLLASLLEI